MMIHIPGKTNEGIVTEKLTEFVDLFPTLVDAAGLPPVPHCPKESNILLKVCTEGDCLIPLVDDPNVPWWKQRVFTQCPRGGRGPLPPAMGYSMRTNQFRYTEWVHFPGKPSFQPIWNVSYGTELYDLKRDPEENCNRVDDPDYLKVQLKLSAQLHAGWKVARRDVEPYKQLKTTEMRRDFTIDLNTTL